MPASHRVQLHRALSKLGICSRTVAWGRIVDGAVRVDGRVVRDPLTWVEIPRQQIECSGAEPPLPPQSPTGRLVLMLHKPRSVVTTRSDELGRRTVYDLLPPDSPWMFPAGRLDADSEGLLILTNDSALSHALTDPQTHVPKTYQVTISGRPAPSELTRLRTGIDLQDGRGRTRPAQVTVLAEDQNTAVTRLEFILTEGRNRQIRRMCEAIGCPVQRLVRVAIGQLSLGDLTAGKTRRLTPREIARLTLQIPHRR